MSKGNFFTLATEDAFDSPFPCQIYFRSPPPVKFEKNATHENNPKCPSCGLFVADSSVSAAAPKIAVAAFDLDGTLIRTRTKRPFPRDADDWEFFDGRAAFGVASKCASDGEHAVIFTNQAGIGTQPHTLHVLAQKLANIEAQLQATTTHPLNLWMFLAPMHDFARKPLWGMWLLFERLLGRWLSQCTCAKGAEGASFVDRRRSFFVGDAAGRPNDHSDCDRKFAHNCTLPFLTPEQFFGGVATALPVLAFDWVAVCRYFLQQQPAADCCVAKLQRFFEAPTAARCVVMVAGPPGAGKSRFLRCVLQPLLDRSQKSVAIVDARHRPLAPSPFQKTTAAAWLRSKFAAHSAAACIVVVGGFATRRERQALLNEAADRAAVCIGVTLPVGVTAATASKAPFNFPLHFLAVRALRDAKHAVKGVDFASVRQNEIQLHAALKKYAAAFEEVSDAEQASAFQLVLSVGLFVEQHMEMAACKQNCQETCNENAAIFADKYLF